MGRTGFGTGCVRSEGWLIAKFRLDKAYSFQNFDVICVGQQLQSAYFGQVRYLTFTRNERNRALFDARYDPRRIRLAEVPQLRFTQSVERGIIMATSATSTLLPYVRLNPSKM